MFFSLPKNVNDKFRDTLRKTLFSLITVSTNVPQSG